MTLKSQKAPSAKRCIKTAQIHHHRCHLLRGQIAPSTKRRIKTRVVDDLFHGAQRVRKHRAPKGALRHIWKTSRAENGLVRKHRAPKGALRRFQAESHLVLALEFRKHRAPKISHVIPHRTITDRRQKPRNINDRISNIERPDRELRATFSSNHARP